MALLLVVFAVVVLSIFLGINMLPKHHPANWLLGIVCLGVCVWRDPARFWMLSIVFIGVIGATQVTALA